MQEQLPTATGSTQKPANWLSGWRLVVAIAAGALAAKLFGAAGAIAAIAVFFWLQPRRGTGLAAGAALLVGVAVAVALSFAILAKHNDPAEPPVSQRPVQPAAQAFDPSTVRPVNSSAGQQPAAQEPTYTSPPGFKPFTGKLDRE